MAEAIELSVVIPVYGCEGCLQALHERLHTSLEATGVPYEVILVDDRSPDGAWSTIRRIAEDDPLVRGAQLSRNFGQHAAITAGLSLARGRWAVVMDCDLQEAPEEIPRLYTTAMQGYDLVHTRRRRRNQRLVRRIMVDAYFRVRNVVLGTDTRSDYGTMSILSRGVIDAFLDVRDVHREYFSVLDWLGFDHTTLEVGHDPRFHGRSSYDVRRLVRVTVDSLLFQTTVLLRWIVLTGLFVAFAGFALAAFYVYTYVTSDPLPGYTSLAVLLLVIGGFIIITCGVIGLYIGKVFEQVKGRPLFVISAECGETARSAGGVPNLTKEL